MALDVAHISSVSAPREGVRLPGSPESRPVSDKKASPLSSAQLEALMADLQRVSATFNRRLAFSVNEKLGQVVVKVIDTDTDKVIKEIPPAELQHVYERIREVIGLLLDEEA